MFSRSATCGRVRSLASATYCKAPLASVTAVCCSQSRRRSGRDALIRRFMSRHGLALLDRRGETARPARLGDGAQRSANAVPVRAAVELAAPRTRVRAAPMSRATVRIRNERLGSLTPSPKDRPAEQRLPHRASSTTARITPSIASTTGFPARGSRRLCWGTSVETAGCSARPRCTHRPRQERRECSTLAGYR